MDNATSHFPNQSFNQECGSELKETLRTIGQTKEILLNIFTNIQFHQQNLEES
ncbi:hypothetical protein [Tepidibacillus sp. LV47]|uniref:hypothetical protein n=1 Tax=Tepidibacillus sp. LV47 TaxID=3398228 RepID=UPI003AB0C0F1